MLNLNLRCKNDELLLDNSESLGNIKNTNIYINIHGDPNTILKIWRTIKKKEFQSYWGEQLFLFE